MFDIHGITVSNASVRKIGFIHKALLLLGLSQTISVTGKDASHEDLHQAADVAQAKTLSKVGKKVCDASGERRKQPIRWSETTFVGARAVIKGPDIYIFDSFSALDYRTDAILRHRLSDTDAAVLIVAQRVGTSMDADPVIVLDKGKLLVVVVMKN